MSEGQRFYSDEEADAILRLAVQRSSPAYGLTKEQLLASAAELGISEEEVAAAEQEYQAQAEAEKERLAFDKYSRNEFWGHLASYLIVNIVLAGIDFRSDGRFGWSYWVLLFWGMGMCYHAWSTFARGSSDYEKEFGRWRAKKALRESGLIDEDPRVRVIGLQARVSRQARKAAQQERKIAAIQHIRERTGLSLPEAEKVVEEYLEEGE